MAIKQEFDLNLIPESEAVVVKVNQYDVGTGRLIAHLYVNELSYIPASGATAKIEGTKPDSKGFSYPASLSGNTVTANLTEQMCAVAGRTRAQIVITETSGRTGTFVFWLEVQKSALGEDTDISATELPDIIDLARRNQEAAEKAAEESKEWSEESEAWAVGKRNGVDVPSTDETYHNNSKWYAEHSQAGKQIFDLTKAEYNALSEEEKMDESKYYWVTE